MTDTVSNKAVMMAKISDKFNKIPVLTRLQLLNAAFDRIRQCGFKVPADHLPATDIKEVVVCLHDLTSEGLTTQQATSYFINTTTLTATGEKCIIFNC